MTNATTLISGGVRELDQCHRADQWWHQDWKKVDSSALPLHHTAGRASRFCGLGEENREYKIKALYVRQEMGLTMDTLPVTSNITENNGRAPRAQQTSEDGGCGGFNITGEGKAEDRL